MTLEEALASFTIDAAYAGHQEAHHYTQEPGKKADFILLDRDILSQPTTQMWQTQVQETWVDGVRVSAQN